MFTLCSSAFLHWRFLKSIGTIVWKSLNDSCENKLSSQIASSPQWPLIQPSVEPAINHLPMKTFISILSVTSSWNYYQWLDVPDENKSKLDFTRLFAICQVHYRIYEEDISLICHLIILHLVGSSIGTFNKESERHTLTGDHPEVKSVKLIS